MNQEATVDVIAVIRSVQDASEAKMKDGSMKPKRTLDLVDNSSPEGVGIQFTVWGDESRVNYNVGDVIAIKAGKLSMWSGKSLSSGFGGKLMINDDIPHPKYREL